MSEKLIKRDEIYNGKVIKVHKDTIEINNEEYLREVVEHPGGVGIALNDHGKYFMVKQFRYALQTYTIEYPAGKREMGEDDLSTAKREIVEEVGYTGKNWMYLGEMYPTPAYDTETIGMYYADCDEFVGQHFDDDEDIEVMMMSLDEIESLIKDGTIKDAKTIVMTYMIKEKVNG